MMCLCVRSGEAEEVLLRQKVVRVRITRLLIGLTALAGAVSCNGDAFIASHGERSDEPSKESLVLRHRTPIVAIEIQTQENTVDGCLDCGCRIQGTLKPGGKAQDWWIAFGQVHADADKGWVAAAASSRCGQGEFESVAASYSQTLGIPYLISEVSISADVLPTGQLDLFLELKKRRLLRFDKNQKAVYQDSVDHRKLRFAADDRAVPLPLLIPDAREGESFNIHEVLLRVNAQLLGREPAASYGAVFVRGDVPGAEILIDGGLVGRIAEGKPTRVENVLAGTREVQVKDFSGREIRRRVQVGSAEPLEVELNLLDLREGASDSALTPIGKNPEGHQEYWRKKDQVMVVEIPAGAFLMGSPENQGEADQWPQHEVELSAFVIDKTEVTWRQFAKFAQDQGKELPPAPLWGRIDDYPASFILWEEAEAYCSWAGGRLPTEAEWEKAARGTDGRKYPWGDDWDLERCNSIQGGPHRPQRIGDFPNCVSPYGVLDMPGSMWEWGADWYGASYYAESPRKDPKGPASGTTRVLRGGAWMSHIQWLTVAHRFKVPPTTRHAHHGFRCAQDAPE